jgi:hypothetical protein
MAALEDTNLLHRGGPASPSSRPKHNASSTVVVCSDQDGALRRWPSMPPASPGLCNDN